MVLLQLRKIFMKINICFFLFYFISSLYVWGQEKDQFEQIALQKRQNTVIGLEENPQPQLPDITLLWDKEIQESFSPLEKISTQKQLDEELKKMRKQYEPFMQDLAPSLPKVRKQYELTEFQWRLLASDMREDEQGNLYPLDQIEEVNQEWETVTIPHYTGPINNAEAIYKKIIKITDEQLASETIFLHFNGADYRAVVFINGQKIGEHIGLIGAFEWDIKPYVKKGQNILEVKIFNEALMMGDNNFLGPKRKFGKKLAACGGPGWNEPGKGKGWNSCPPGFGIWQRCYLETRSAAFIKNIYVQPLLNESKVEVYVEIHNDMQKDLDLFYSLYGQNFQMELVKDKKVIQSEQKSFSTIHYKISIPIPSSNLKVWSLETPWLYQIQLKLKNGNQLIDTQKEQFGMRSFKESTTSIPKGRFYLNGEEIKLRGANMMGNLMQCVIRKDLDQLRDDILLAKIAGMNFWRMTQQPCQEEVFDYFDKLGMLSQTDMPCFNGYRKDAVEEVLPQFKELMYLVRNHPCNAIISYCNEPDFNKPMMLNREQHKELFIYFDSIANQMNPGQVTKWIDGDYINISQKHSDHHCYETWYGNNMRNQYLGGWYNTVAGWMCSCGEFGAEGLDEISLMKKYYPESWRTSQKDGKWSPNQIPSCQTERVGEKWLQISSGTITDWVNNSREYQMWATRLFTEALRRNPKINSFAIHLLIDAWPASWLKSIMDTDRHAKPAYFAYRDALTPIAVNLRPDEFYGFSGDSTKVAVFICNDTPKELVGCKLYYQIQMDGKTLCTGNSEAFIPASEPQFQGYLKFRYPNVSSRNKIVIQVGLTDEFGKLKHDSNYELDVLPTTDKGKNLKWIGGYPQRLIQK